jgi:hypothetical protein
MVSVRLDIHQCWDAYNDDALFCHDKSDFITKLCTGQWHFARRVISFFGQQCLPEDKLSTHYANGCTRWKWSVFKLKNVIDYIGVGIANWTALFHLAYSLSTWEWCTVNIVYIDIFHISTQSQSRCLCFVQGWHLLYRHSPISTFLAGPWSVDIYDVDCTLNLICFSAGDFGHHRYAFSCSTMQCM